MLWRNHGVDDALRRIDVHGYPLTKRSYDEKRILTLPDVQALLRSQVPRSDSDDDLDVQEAPLANL